jgi:uncharacterized protein HemX
MSEYDEQPPEDEASYQPPASKLPWVLMVIAIAVGVAGALVFKSDRDAMYVKLTVAQKTLKDLQDKQDMLVAHDKSLEKKQADMDKAATDLAKTNSDLVAANDDLQKKLAATLVDTSASTRRSKSKKSRRHKSSYNSY